MIQAIFVVGTLFSGCDEMLVGIFQAAITSGQGFDAAGVDLNAYDLAPNYIGPFKAFVFTVATLGTIPAPYVIGILTPHVNHLSFILARTINRKNKIISLKLLFHGLQAYLPEWQTVFWLTFSVYVSSAIIFLIWGSSEVQPWNTPRKNIRNA